MMKLRLIFFATLFALTHHCLNAELVWTEGRGWQAQGGLTAQVLGDDLGNQNALELMNKARSRQEKKRYWSALSLYDDVVDDYPQSIYAPEALFQRGKIYTDRKQFQKANKELTSIIKRYPEYDKFNQVIGQIYSIGEMMGEGARPRYWGIIPGFRDYEAAQSILEGVISLAPYSEYAPLSLINITSIAKKRKEPEEAIDALDRLINDYPESTFSEDAYLSLAGTYSELVQGADYDQGSTREAISYFEDFMILYPDSQQLYDAEAGLYYMKDTLAKSKLELGHFYYKYRNNFRAALVFYNEAITVDPKSASAEKAREMIAQIEQGIEAPATPVDWLFGRYQQPLEREVVPLEDQAVEEFKPTTSDRVLEAPEPVQQSSQAEDLESSSAVKEVTQ